MTDAVRERPNIVSEAGTFSMNFPSVQMCASASPMYFFSFYLKY